MIPILLFVVTICRGIDDISNPSGSELRNAFLLSVGAGLSTVIGAAAAFCLRKDDIQKERSPFLAACLSFAASVMVYVSFIEIWPEALIQFEEVTDDEQVAHIYTSLTFFAGILVGFLCSKSVQWFEQTHSETKSTNKSKEVGGVEMLGNSNKVETDSEENLDIPERDEQKAELLRTGIITAISIALHNFPEGLVTFLAALADWKVGVATAFAIAIHNIPEGISISIPYYYASESRWKAFLLAFLSGLAEPVGALIGWAILGDVWGHEVFGLMFGLTAGIMVFISFNELLPLARKNDPEDKLTTMMIFLGMFVMDLSLFVAA